MQYEFCCRIKKQMMKNLILILFVIASSTGFSQGKYVLYEVTPATPGSCDAVVKVVPYGFKSPVQFIYMSSEKRIGNELEIVSLCSGEDIYMELRDSACTFQFFDFKLANDPDSQVIVYDIDVIMPTSSTSNDGAITFSVDEGLTPVIYRFGETSSGPHPIVTDSVFTGLDDIEYQLSFYHAITGAWLGSTKVTLDSYTPPCTADYDFNPVIYKPTIGNCDGHIQIVPTAGDTADYAYSVYNFGVGISSVELSNGFTVSHNVCSSPVYMRAVRTTGVPNQFIRNWKVYFIGEDSLSTYSWSPPSASLPAGIDTVVMSATYNCSIDYTSSPDTIYIDSIFYIGANLYQFNLVIEQDTSIYEFSGTLTVDTSGSFFVDFTLYCADTNLTRSGSPYIAMRNLIYHGDHMTLGVEDAVNDAVLQIIPNPARNEVIFDIKGNIFSSIGVYNLNGELMYSEVNAFNRKTIDISNWPSSVYIVNYVISGEKSGYMKLVKL